jgi:hypothetical protein
MKLVADSFLASYRDENGTGTIAKAKGVRYLLPFQPFLKSSITAVIRDSLERHSSPYGAGQDRLAELGHAAMGIEPGPE